MLKNMVFFALVIIAESYASPARKQPHYKFLLPDGYVGWVQIVFNDPDAPALAICDGGYVVDVPESGITRTSDIRVHDFKRRDEFYYHVSTGPRASELRPAPTEAVLPGDSQGGFGVMDTGGKGIGYSWFIFIGPPTMRANVPFADWDKVVEAWQKIHGNARASVPDPYPSPGRMDAAAPLNAH